MANKSTAVKVLVTDDEEDALLIFKLKFKKEIRAKTIELYYANSVDQALDILNGPNGSCVEFILSDINMPNRDGFDLLEEVNKNFPGKKLAFISAYNNHEHKTKARDMGAQNFFEKPVDFKLLKNFISL